MFRVEMLEADHGDCLWVEYGDTQKPHLILIDGGTPATWKRLEQRIRREKEKRRQTSLHFEAFIVTHVDADHVGGAIKLLEQVGPLELTFGDVWFNGYQHLLDVAGGKMGEQLSALIEGWNLNWNRHFENDRVVVPDDGPLPVKNLAGLALTLLSPTPAKLRALLPKWRKEVLKAGLVPGKAYRAVDVLSSDDDAQDTADDAVSDDVSGLAESVFTDDRAEANGSSIAFLAEYEGRSVLFGADAHANVLLESLARLPKRVRPKLLDGFKVSHHGSRSNTSKELVEASPAKAYLISTNGNQFGHPHQEAIARIVIYGPKAKRLLFNCRSDFNERWGNAAVATQFGYEALYGTDEGGQSVAC